MQTRSFVPYLVLFGGVLMAASASILIRLAQDLGLPSTTIAAGRMGMAALVLQPLMLWFARDQVRHIRRRDLLLGLASGAMLALHFTAWISSLEYTSVASSAALVATNPLWVALAALFIFREKLPLVALAGVLLTVAGSVLIGLSDSGASAAPNALLGDGLALIGAITGSAYFLIGRELRGRLSLLAYIWLVYSTAAVLLAAVALLDGRGAPVAATGSTLLGYPLAGVVLMAGLALGPQLLGHTAFNWSLRYLSATFVATAILGEPIGSALLAFFLFNEQFAPLQLVGFVILLVGIAVATRAEQGQPVPSPADRPDVVAATGVAE